MTGKSDPFLQVCRPKEGKRGVQYQPVFQTAVIHDNANPRWPPQEVALGSLCGGDLQSSLLFRVRSSLESYGMP